MRESRKHEQLLSTSDTARATGYSRDNIRLLARTGQLPVACVVGNGQRLFHPRDVYALARKRQARRAARTVRKG